MELSKKLELLEEIMDLENGFLVPEMKLEGIEEYDSMAKMSLIVLMHDECGKKITMKEISNFTTVQDILDFMG